MKLNLVIRRFTLSQTEAFFCNRHITWPFLGHRLQLHPHIQNFPYIWKMEEAYQIKNQESLFFLTFQVVGWADVYSRHLYIQRAWLQTTPKKEAFYWRYFLTQYPKVACFILYSLLNWLWLLLFCCHRSIRANSKMVLSSSWIIFFFHYETTADHWPLQDGLIGWIQCYQ